MDKNVKLKSLRLLNFKGIKELTVNFGEVTTIAGANATGKSTIFDAFTWCLFGKDANGKTDFELKTKQNGVVIPKIEHEVTAVLEVNGEEVSLTRTLNEDWVKPRGKAEPELKGNTTHYLVNGVEIKAGAFQERVTSIVEEQLFKLITNPSYFPSLDCKKQREILLTIAGGVTYEEVASQRADFVAILTQLGGKDIAEFKQEIAYRKKKIQAELDKCPVEINAIDSVTPVAPDYEALEAEKTRITNELEQVDGEITNVSETARKHYASEQAKRKEINDLRSKQQNVIYEAKQAAQKAGYEANAKRNEAKNSYDITKREATNYGVTSERELSDIRRQIEANNQRIATLNKQVEAKLSEWYKRNAEEYQVSTEGLLCPLYKTLCSDASVLRTHEDAQAKAKATFEATKDSDLERITSEGQGLKKQIEEAQVHGQILTAQLEEQSKAIEAKKAKYNDDLVAIQAQIDATPEVQVTTDINPAELPSWAELEAQISTISGTIEELPETDTATLTERKKNLTALLDEAKRKLSLRSVIENNTTKKNEILKREKELAQQKADLEGQEFTIEELNKARMDEVERRVNSKFQTVRFQMYEKQLNGGEKEVCNILIGGVKYGYGANRAAEVWAGLDIINTLQNYHEVTAPLFCDNAEAVNTFPAMNCQMIYLKVTNEEKLTINEK